MILVTGGAGFIGSNIIKELNKRGKKNIIIVDNINEEKLGNLNDLDFSDYVDKDRFFKQMENTDVLNDLHIDTIIHQGACTNTTEANSKYIMENNFEFSKLLIENWKGRSDKADAPFIYASSASVYGKGTNGFKETSYKDEEKGLSERPINVYGFSKLMFDNYLNNFVFDNYPSLIVGLRYFNVFGPREGHKGSMASMIYQIYNQIKDLGQCFLFGENGEFEQGEQRRDFIYVKDVVDVVMYFLDNKENHKLSGIYNCGTGKSTTFNTIANHIIEELEEGSIVYEEFPLYLEGKYQNFTQADITKLREEGGYKKEFTPVEDAVTEYIEILNEE